MTDTIRTDAEILAFMRVTAAGRIDSQRMRDLYVTLANRGPEFSLADVGFVPVVNETGDGVEYVSLPSEALLPPITAADEGKILAIQDGAFVLIDPDTITMNIPQLSFDDPINSQYLALIF